MARRIKRKRKTRGKRVSNEIEVNWLRRAKTWKRVETLVKQAAERINWDPELVWGLVQEHWERGNSAYNARDQHFGFDITWYDDDELRVYMYGQA